MSCFADLSYARGSLHPANYTILAINVVLASRCLLNMNALAKGTANEKGSHRPRCNIPRKGSLSSQRRRPIWRLIRMLLAGATLFDALVVYDDAIHRRCLISHHAGLIVNWTNAFLTCPLSVDRSGGQYTERQEQGSTKQISHRKIPQIGCKPAGSFMGAIPMYTPRFRGH